MSKAMEAPKSMETLRTETLIKYFKERLEYWKDLLGFTEVELGVLGHEGDYRACWEVTNPDLILHVWYNPQWISRPDVTLQEVDKVAFHEIYEASVFYEIPLDEWVSEDRKGLIMHRAVRRAENTIFRAMRGNEPTFEREET